MLYKKHVLVAMALLFLIFFSPIPSLSPFIFIHPVPPTNTRSIRTPCRARSYIHSHVRTHRPAAHTAAAAAAVVYALSFLELYYKALGEYLHTRAYEREWCTRRGAHPVMDGEKKEAERTVVVVVVVGALKQKPVVVRRRAGASGKNNLIGFKNY